MCSSERKRRPLALGIQLALLAITGCASPGGSGPAAPLSDLDISVQEVYYDVIGSTADEMARSIHEQRPQKGEGWAVAQTEWSARVEVRQSQELYGCRIERARINLFFIVTLPRWRPGAAVNEELRSQWDEFLAAVVAHEETHKQITTAQAREFAKSLGELRSRSCSALQEAVDIAKQRFVGRAQELNDGFDRDTANGDTEGVRWPPSGSR